MNPAIIILVLVGLLASGAPYASGVAVMQTAPSQQTAQPDATPAPAPPAVTPPKPCPAVSPSTSSPQPDCAPTAKSKKHRRRQTAAAPGSGPTKKIVHNGSTGDVNVEIAPGVTEQQVSQQISATNDLLAMTDENLKTIKSRKLTAGQQDTVDQIKNYMEQSRSASRNGDVQRAYTLANKARMLSGDLVKH
jgi:hypothetical protein